MRIFDARIELILKKCEKVAVLRYKRSLDYHGYMQANRKVFIYIRGLPGSGKITTARVLKKKLNYHLFWFHDLKNSVYKVVKEHRIPKLMDEVTIPIVRYLLRLSKPIIYVRPASTPSGIEKVKKQVERRGYKFHLITLTAPYQALVKRISKRKGRYRIRKKEDFDKYLVDKKVDFRNYKVRGLVIDTSRLSPEKVADKIIKKLKL